MDYLESIPLPGPWPDARYVIEPFAGETLVFDSESERFHCLNNCLMRIWDATDGRTSARALSRAIDLPTPVIECAWLMLSDAGLITKFDPPGSVSTLVGHVFHLIASGQLPVDRLPIIVSTA